MSVALIDPNASVQHTVSWTTALRSVPVFETYPNSARVAEVASVEFEVASPLFWVACDDTIVADQWYYDTVTSTFAQVVNEPRPVQPQPVVEGAQTL
jgi:hypothetical protein